MVMGSLRISTEVAVIGAGPGGYVAALRLADLGKEVTLIDARKRPGGTCLLEGCIPSKALISAVELKESAARAAKIGLNFAPPEIDLDALRAFSDEVVSGLSNGVKALLKNRGVEVLHGRARFSSSNSLEIEGGEISGVDFKQVIIATGSIINELPATYSTPTWTSADALKLPHIPKTMLVVGGGYIGLEMGLVYAGLGCEVSVAEFSPRLLMGADEDLVNIMIKRVRGQVKDIMLDSKVSQVEHKNNVFHVVIEQGEQKLQRQYDQVLVAVGRRPATDDLGLENTRVVVDAHGFINTDDRCRTSESHIYAIGDSTHGPMLAHKASREGKVAAEVIAAHPSAFDNRAVPAVVFTDPEIAWTGLTEREAKERGEKVQIGKFPLSALGRARTLGRTDGLVKVIIDPEHKLVLGVGIVGPHASELIAEGTLAIEMGATVEDIIATIHPHPTLSEAIMEAAEVASGAAVHLMGNMK